LTQSGTDVDTRINSSQGTAVLSQILKTRTLGRGLESEAVPSGYVLVRKVVFADADKQGQAEISELLNEDDASSLFL